MATSGGFEPPTICLEGRGSYPTELRGHYNLLPSASYFNTEDNSLSEFATGVIRSGSYLLG